jgi:hypothetical protein
MFFRCRQCRSRVPARTGLRREGHGLTDGFQDGYAIEFRAATYRLPSGLALISGLEPQDCRGRDAHFARPQRFRQDHHAEAHQPPLGGLPKAKSSSQGVQAVLGCIQLRRGIGYVIQDAGLFPIGLWSRMLASCPGSSDGRKTESRRACGRCFRLVGLPPEEFAQRRPSGAFRRAETARGSRPGVGCGPSYLIDGRAFRGARSHYPR